MPQKPSWEPASDLSKAEKNINNKFNYQFFVESRVERRKLKASLKPDAIYQKGHSSVGARKI